MISPLSNKCENLTTLIPRMNEREKHKTFFRDITQLTFKGKLQHGFYFHIPAISSTDCDNTVCTKVISEISEVIFMSTMLSWADIMYVNLNIEPLLKSLIFHIVFKF